MPPRASKKESKIKEKYVIAAILRLRNAFSAIFVLVPSHDAVFEGSFMHFRGLSNDFLCCFGKKVKRQKYTFGTVFYNIISRSGKSNPREIQSEFDQKTSRFNSTWKNGLRALLWRPKFDENWQEFFKIPWKLRKTKGFPRFCFPCIIGIIRKV